MGWFILKEKDDKDEGGTELHIWIKNTPPQDPTDLDLGS